MKSLFNNAAFGDDLRPLADKVRPQSFSHVYGQEHLVGKDGVITKYIESGNIPSFILWGPPGAGKTTIAKLIANNCKGEFVIVSAVTSGVADLKKIFADAMQRHSDGFLTFLMVDEIHRFNRSQQDAFLPYIEDGTIILIGATTENPSFELNSALLSRCKVITLNPLDNEALLKIIEMAEGYYEQKLPVLDECKEFLCDLADGDGRYLLGLCEELFSIKRDGEYNLVMLKEFLNKRAPVYDKNKDSHYNLISALHKSLRGSDVNAALYWFARMITGGEDPLYIARRLIRFAVEDISMADPNALVQAMHARDAYNMLGSPEGELAISQAVIYLATAPKSNAAYSAFKSCMSDAKSNNSYSPPKHILNAPTKLMQELDYGRDYQYDHNCEDGFSGQNYFPDDMDRREYYIPVERGFERDIAKRLEYWQKLRDKKKSEQSESGE